MVFGCLDLGFPVEAPAAMPHCTHACVVVVCVPAETCINTIIPLVCKFCQQAMASEDNTLATVAKQLGRLSHGLSGEGDLQIMM